MLRNSALFAFYLLLFGLSCHFETEKPELYPSDYLFAQRSYPYGKVDLQAYQEALQYRFTTNTKRLNGFDDPWTYRGPENISGRVTDIEVDPLDPAIIYTGTASGGIFKSYDQGVSWEAIFDGAASLSIGDMAIDQSNSDIIYAGTGESNAGGGSIAYDGNGVYKSIDGGNTWNHLGPENVGSIGRIILDPENSDKVYVAAMGSLFENNAERGVYKTEDGGLSWNQILTVSDSTGAIDLVIHPNNSDTIYAAMWERIRRVDHRQYGGETSNIYRSYDGGKSWTKLETGLPALPEEKGRIGLAISQSEPNILYAYYARSNGLIQGIYKTEDNGDSWILKSTDKINNVGFMWWFGKIFVDPTDSDKVYATSLNLFASNDGAETWERVFDGAHVDHHALAFDPSQKDFLVNGNDGGVNISYDGGLTHLPSIGLNNIQFYTCEIDPNNPNVIYGGAQDNGTLKTDSTANGWRSIFGGDGFRVVVDPNNSRQIYFESQYGNIFASTNGGQTFYYGRTGLIGNFNWNTPIAIDPVNTEKVYTGSQYLFRTDSLAYQWHQISDDLTLPRPQQGNIFYGSITSIDVSSIDPNTIYIGTDNGKLWVTRDGGITYQDIGPGIPDRWITSVVHDPNSESGVFVTVSGFRFAESDSHVFYSDDFGDNWQSIGSNLPDVPVNDIVVDPYLDEHLYLATDIGIFVSGDMGENWETLGNNVPIVPILDLDIEPDSRSLLAASYGRGMLSYTLPVNSSIIEDLKDETVDIYPNPSEGIFHYSMKEKPHSIKLFTLNGSFLTDISPSESIDLSDFESGIYIIQFRFKSRYFTRKIVKL